MSLSVSVDSVFHRKVALEDGLANLGDSASCDEREEIAESVKEKASDELDVIFESSDTCPESLDPD